MLSKQYAQALQVYLRVGRSDVFALISNLELFSAVRDKVLALMQFDSAQAIQLLIENVERIPPRDVVEQLASQTGSSASVSARAVPVRSFRGRKVF